MPAHEDFRRILEEHGYGFQYAVLERAKQLFEAGRSLWRYQVTEFPVSVKDRTTHVDFLLSHGDWPALLVGECKRCEPGQRWGFARVPHAQSRTQFETAYQVVPDDFPEDAHVQTGLEREHRSNVYHLGFEIGGRSKALKDAIAQVTTGTNGVIEELAMFGRLLKDLGPRDPRNEVRLIPTIFTTARLLVTDTDLGTTSLSDGRLPEDPPFTATELDWLFLTVNQSRDLKHQQAALKAEPARLRELVERDYERTIVIVSPTGVDSFLSMNWA